MMNYETPSPSADPTLHKPRILCLHGGGTNARIFRAQCRVLERSLSPYFRLCYAEAPFSSKPGPDVVSVYKSYGPFKAWLRWSPEDPHRDATSAIERIQCSLLDAMAEDDEKGATGEWVGLLGFSQGAKICASLLYMQQFSRDVFGIDTDWPQFRFAVLLAGRGPLVSLIPDMPVPHGLVPASAVTTTAVEEKLRFPMLDLIRIPTIHYHGLKDPNIQLHRRLLHEYFDKRYVRVQEWEGGHRIPIKTKDVNRLVEEIIDMAIQSRALSRFECDYFNI
ncbi:hypothetical protein PTNB73_01235 [Pyrenophora teres f. teres]|nr:hypothetical protein HRS9122_02506 [Pyrenophora teres f. teres]KAE8874603.1 hypothetical protein PTNB73_01235 [Pyrenophora teres f. teres]